MDHEEIFISEIQKNRRDEQTRLVYADWLEEREPSRAEYIRTEVEFSNTNPVGAEAEFLYRKLVALIYRKDTDVTKSWVNKVGMHFEYWLMDIEHKAGEIYADSINAPIVETVMHFSGLNKAQSRALIYGFLPAVVANDLTFENLLQSPSQFGSPIPITRPNPEPVFLIR